MSGVTSIWKIRQPELVQIAIDFGREIFHLPGLLRVNFFDRAASGYQGESAYTDSAKLENMHFGRKLIVALAGLFAFGVEAQSFQAASIKTGARGDMVSEEAWESRPRVGCR